MGFFEKCLVCNKTRLLIAVVVAVVVLIISLAIGFTVKKYQAEKNLPYATEKWELPTNYRARRPKGIDIYNDMLYLSPGGDEIGQARKCVSCSWTIYMLNKNEEIAVVVRKKVWSWTDNYDVEEQWKTNSTRYKIEYSWSGSGITKEVYVIKDSNGDEIARTDRFRLEFGKTIKIKDSKSGSTLGMIERPTFQLYPTWEITVNNKNVVPTYLYGAIATITTLREADDDN
ncbi:hypothetical protein OS493_031980 [Desmophyllum pertusum]|uniref:Uncharacterized protein n=1 Tax=Desmophyllum pertusum TaxID=174260 RepID=A0A9W9Z830_9CNID|nr:hypothetical protein OS493_031980 [Desmophyllum pertusum]